jgi:eukaryotic-like serine/threonine-protein kinase
MDSALQVAITRTSGISRPATIARTEEQEAPVSVTIPVFWQLLQDSRLLGREQCQQLAADFSQVKGSADSGSAKVLAEWLVSRNVLSKYQTTILLAGRAGPFLYGEYKVYDRVEKGRLEGLFRGVHGPTGHPVLLTFLGGPALTDPNQWAVATASTWHAASIVSPHVQRWFEPVDCVVYKFAVSEDLRGATAEERMTGSRFPPAEACRIARLAALGLAQLHQAGRVHGELRPANLLLEPIPGQAANIKLLWNGHEGAAPWNMAEEPPGKRLAAMADFLAPELATSAYPPDALADIYSLGCTLFTILAGRPPFAGGTIAEKMTRHGTEATMPLEQFGVPQSLAQLVAYLMAKNPAVRYQSAALVAEQLAVFVEPAALYAQSPPTAPTLGRYVAYVRQKQPPALPPAPPSSHHAQAETPSGFPVLGPRRVVFTAESFAQPATTTFDPAMFPGPASNRPSPLGPPFPVTQPNSESAAPFQLPTGPPPGSPSVAPQTESFAFDTSASAPAKPPATAPAASVPAQKRAARRQNQNLATAAGVVAACILVAVVSVVVLLNSNFWNDNTGQQVATAGPGVTPVEEPGNGAPAATPVTPASSGPKMAPVADPAGSNGNTESPATKQLPSTAPTPAPVGDGSFQQEVLPDDGKLLWASPTTGKPISERLIAPDAQVFVFVRPADLIASGEGEKVLQALGPNFAAQRSAFEKASALGLAEVEQLLMTLHPNDAKFPRACFVVRATSELPPDQLLARWNNPIPAQEGMATYYTGGGWGYYISTSPEDPRTFVMGDPRDVKEVAKAAGNPPSILRDVRRILRTTDANRHFTAIVAPTFLMNDDGEPLFAAERAKVRQPLSWLLGDGIQAAAVSMHFGPEFYVELRMLGSLDKEPFLLSSEIKSRLNQAPREIENYLVGLTPPPYWKKLSFRYPEMLRHLQANLRVGVENDQAVVNSVLPVVAAHNLMLGGELLMSSAAGGGAIAATSPMPTKVLPKSLEEALQLKTTFTFDQQSLEFAMRDLAIDAQDQLKGSTVEFAIKIIGGDLEAGSITRNQSIRDFKHEDKTFAEILTALVMKANPITTVKSPTEADQKLVWVIGPDPADPAKQIILITTRAAAGTKKYTLPAVFVGKEDGKKKGK